MANPGNSAVAIAVILGIVALAWGLVFVVLALLVRKQAKEADQVVATSLSGTAAPDSSRREGDLGARSPSRTLSLDRRPPVVACTRTRPKVPPRAGDQRRPRSSRYAVGSAPRPAS